MKMAVALNFNSNTFVHEFADTFMLSKSRDADYQLFIEQIRMKNDTYYQEKLNTEPQKTESEKNLDKLLSHISKDDFAKGIQGGDLVKLVQISLNIGEKKARNTIAELKDEGLIILVGQKYFLAGSSINSMPSSESISIFDKPQNDDEVGF
jgi:hypothetical protein